MDYSDEFKALFKDGYGPQSNKQKPDYSKCCSSVWRSGSWWPSQCSFKNGHGPHGAYCKRHVPDYVTEQYEKRNAAYREKRKLEMLSQLRGADDVLQRIADGHNDPRALAREWIDNVLSKIGNW